MSYLVKTCRIVFFFQAEDGIRDDLVTGVQTCALPIYSSTGRLGSRGGPVEECRAELVDGAADQIGRASCRERVYDTIADEAFNSKITSFSIILAILSACSIAEMLLHFSSPPLAMIIVF